MSGPNTIAGFSLDLAQALKTERQEVAVDKQPPHNIHALAGFLHHGNSSEIRAPN